uniref:Uncharacterized protein n=1 Tax=Cuerna arida TaxID=1464854 RepID=A0A1B6F3I6_9HEMI
MNFYFISMILLVLHLSFYYKSVSSLFVASASGQSQPQAMLLHPVVLLPYTTNNNGIPSQTGTSGVSAKQVNAVINKIENSGLYQNSGTNHGGIMVAPGTTYVQLNSLGKKDNSQDTRQTLTGNKQDTTIDHQENGKVHNKLAGISSINKYNLDLQTNNYQTDLNKVTESSLEHNVINDNNHNAINNEINNTNYYVNYGIGHGGIITSDRNVGTQHNQLDETPGLSKFNINKDKSTRQNVIIDKNHNSIKNTVNNNGSYVNYGTGHGGITIYSENKKTQQKSSNPINNFHSTGENKLNEWITTKLDTNKENQKKVGQLNQPIAIPSFEKFNPLLKISHYQIGPNAGSKLKITEDSITSHNGNYVKGVHNNIDNDNSQHEIIYFQSTGENDETKWTGMKLDTNNYHQENEGLQSKLQGITTSFNNFNPQLKIHHDKTGLTVGPKFYTIKDSIPGYKSRNGNNFNVIRNDINNNGIYVNKGDGHGGIIVKNVNDKTEHKVSSQTNHFQSTDGNDKISWTGKEIDTSNSFPGIIQKQNRLTEILNNSNQVNTQFKMENNIHITNIENKLNYLSEKLTSSPDYSTATYINNEMEKVNEDLKVFELKPLPMDYLTRVRMLREKANELEVNIRSIIRTFVEIPLKERINNLLILVKNAKQMKLGRKKLKHLQKLERNLEALKVDLQFSNNPKTIKLLKLHFRKLEKQLYRLRRFNLSPELISEVARFENFCSLFGDFIPQLTRTFTFGLFA